MKIVDDNNPNVVLGLKISLLRNKRKMSQAELAQQCGMNRTYIGALERGEKSATVNTLYKLSEGLGVEVKDLFDTMTF